MNISKNALIASTLLILSTQVFASIPVYGDYGVHHENRVLKTADANTKEVAYQLGIAKIHSLETDSASELNQDLGGLTTAVKSIQLHKGAYVEVAEKRNAEGEMIYNGLINVTVTYSQEN